MHRHKILAVVVFAASVAVGVPLRTPIVEAASTSTVDIIGPVGSGAFGERVLVLSNGNFVVGDSSFDTASTADVGAVFLYDGITNSLISVLRGSTANDRIGSGSIAEVGDGNFVVRSPLWDNGALADAGALTWVNGTTGLSGEVSSANSLVGSQAADGVGTSVRVLTTSKNYIAITSGWDNGAIVDAGAATWASGNAGISGTINATNSLIGSHASDGSSMSSTATTTGENAVITMRNWDRGAVVDAGAATFMNGSAGRVGIVSDTNSLVGVHASDRVGTSVTPLTGGQYVVASSSWDNGATLDVGAVTWVDAAGSLVGSVTTANSLIGATANDQVGTAVRALSNGNYVVSTAGWDRGAIVDAGAVTWGNGASGTTGTVGLANSWVGTKASDRIGSNTIGLSNGNIVTGSGNWDNGAIVDAGAATWINGGAATAGVVGTANSLYGTHTSDLVGGIGLFAFKPGNNYVVDSSGWNNGAVTQVGAITWGNGTTGTVGPVSAANSFIGGTAGDRLGGDIGGTLGDLVVVQSFSVDIDGVVDAGALTLVSNDTPTAGVASSANQIAGSHTGDLGSFGTYLQLPDQRLVFGSSTWDNGAIVDAGALRIFPGTTGASGKFTAANSLVGTKANDHVGSVTTVLKDGNIVVGSPDWDNGALVDAGAATWRNTSVPLSGNVTSANSFVGSATGDRVGSVLALADGDYLTVSLNVDTGGTPDTGAVTYAPVGGLIGAVGSSDSVRGLAANGGTTMSAGSAPTASGGILIRRPADNIVTVLYPPAKPNYVSLSPARLADTRPGESTVDGAVAGGGVIAGGSTLELSVAGRGGVAGDAVAAGLNITAVDPVADGFLTAWPCGSPQPTASNLNFTTGSTVPNAVLAKLGTGGKVCVFVSQTTHLVVDVNGYFPTTSSYVSANPARVLDTRPGQVTADGLQQGAGPSAGDTVTEVQITGRAGVPTNATAAALNVTVTEPVGAGYLTVFPCGQSVPTASNLNYVTGATVANLVVSKLGTGGKVCIYTQMTAHLVVDVNGYFPAVTTYTSLNPARLLETRAGLSTIDGQLNATGKQTARTELALPVLGRGGVPGDADTVVLNVTVTEPVAAGYVTVYPCGISPPLASNLNYAAGQTIANAVLVKVGASGSVCIIGSQTTHIVVDVNGYFPS